MSLNLLIRKHLLPQFNAVSVLWALHRLTGVALAVYLVPHFITIHDSRQGESVFNETLAWFQGPLIAAAEFVIVLAVAFHALNGLRIIAVDFFDLSHRQKWLCWAVLVSCGAVFLASSLWFVPKILAPA
ncbi:MAG: succinate dehydrogenase, cytochrome b556 subunit [SAR324 cluster bacterium]|nr:succinate dehydrogenase, cytochrome b556 subunit [SAR324 cluster bacterium]